MFSTMETKVKLIQCLLDGGARRELQSKIKANGENKLE